MSQGTPAEPVGLDYASPNGPERQFLGHPVGLYVLFFTELWERFNFYGMRALLIFYMTKMLAFDDKLAATSYGAYNGLVYATPLLGGLLADRILGYRRSILLGGILMAAGEFGLALAGFGVIPQNLTSFYASLALIIIGNGFFKPNISTMVGSLYKQGDPRRDGAFTIFYMGINIGAFLAPLACGTIGELYGYHYGFAIAGFGMLLGLVCFALFQKHLGRRGFPPRFETIGPKAPAFTPGELGIYLGSLLVIPAFAYLAANPVVVEHFAAPIVGGLFLVYVLWEASRSTPDERHGIFVIIILTIFSIMFWAFFEQAGSSMNLFTDRHVDRTVFGWEIPASAFQSVNALFIVLLAPLFSMLWLALGRRGKDPSSAVKFALALVQLGVGFVAMVWAAKQAEASGKSALILLIGAYFFHTTGELCLSPVGLSMVTKMAPNRLASLLMGLWLLSSAFAHIVGGQLASMSEDWGFGKLYSVIVGFAVGSGVLLFIVSPKIKKWEKARLASHK